MFEIFLRASGIEAKDDPVKVATFLHVAGDHAVAVYNSFRWDEQGDAEGDDQNLASVMDSSDIVDKKLKLILGLIWTLILHYSISMPLREGEEPTPSEGGPTPEQRLLNWIQTKIPDLPIENFTTDWNDGRAIGVLVDAVGTGLCPDWDAKKRRQNAKEAMDAAEKWLDVPQCEVIFNNDRNLTYSCCYVPTMEGKCKVIIKFSGKEIPKSPYEVDIEGAEGNASKCTAYGPGLERSGNMVNKRTYFEVNTTDAGQGTVDVVILDPHGRKDSVRPAISMKGGAGAVYNVEYIPLEPGLHSVNVFFAGSAIPGSPFGVGVEY